MDAKELLRLVGETGQDMSDILLELIEWYAEESRSYRSESVTRGEILNGAVRYAKALGCKTNGWIDAIDYLAEKAGYTDIPF